MLVACLDLEGVLVPEIWINVAERTGIDDLRLTTRDIADYDELMTHRLAVMDREKLGLADVQEVIATLTPLPGAPEFLQWLRENFQVLILSDTFYQFAQPLMAQLGYPTLWCHDLEVDDAGRISAYRLRMPNQKYHAVRALQQLNLRCIAAGDSYNDTAMLVQAEVGILFDPPDAVVAEFPSLPVARGYAELTAAFRSASTRRLT